MDDRLKVDTVNYDVYKNAKSGRPAWATALIIAIVAFIAAAFAAFAGTWGAAWLLFAATGVALLASGVLALMNVSRRDA